MSSTNFNAGIDSSDLQIISKKESAWGANPAGGSFKTLRILSESLAETKTRSRPAEIEAGGFAAHGITTQCSAGGDISFAISYGTMDDFLEGMLNSTFGSEKVVTGGNGAVAAVAASKKFTGTSLFAGAAVGDWVYVSGFVTNLGNNGWHRVTAKSANDITVASVLVNETPSGAVKLRGAQMKNGVVLNSHTIQKRLATSLFLIYTGAYVSGGSISASVGDFYTKFLQP